MTTTRLTAVGDGLGIVLPEELLKHIQGAEGDELKLITLPNGIALQRVDSQTARQIEVACEVMEDRRDALRRLAE